MSYLNGFVGVALLVGYLAIEQRGTVIFGSMDSRPSAASGRSGGGGGGGVFFWGSGYRGGK